VKHTDAILFPVFIFPLLLRMTLNCIIAFCPQGTDHPVYDNVLMPRVPATELKHSETWRISMKHHCVYSLLTTVTHTNRNIPNKLLLSGLAS